MNRKALKYLTQNERTAVNELLSRLKDRFGDQLKTVRIFGSKVKGNFDESSDIDLFVMFDCQVDWKFKDQIYEIIFQLDLKYDVLISARIYSVRKLNNDLIKELPFIQNVAKNGIDIL